MTRPIRRALLSVSDKAGLVEFARDLAAAFGVELVATGGTRKALADAGLAVRDVAELTGFPEILDGRVKTLHPALYAGLLADRAKPDHLRTLAEHGLPEIDLVVCNLYPFEETVAAEGATEAGAVERIDIGGPCMVRAAAKNFAAVAAVVLPEQYGEVLMELKNGDGTLSLDFRRHLAAAAFRRIAQYDEAIADYFEHAVAGDGGAGDGGAGDGGTGADEWDEEFDPPFDLKQTLRYGENPHQKAAFYAEPDLDRACVAAAVQVHGKELSYNNILDLDSALNLVREFDEPAAAVVKHNNPCGAAVGADAAEAFRLAWDGDPVSAFGGILAFNRTLDAAAAAAIAEPGRFVECIAAPDFAPEALAILTTVPKWKANVRLLKTGPLAGPPQGLDYRRVDGGLLVQARDAGADDFSKWETRTQRAPTVGERTALEFAWLVCKHVKSNAIVLARGKQVVGVGAGQMSRVDSTRIAVEKAGERARGAVLASDAFFPFRDNADAAAAAGVTAVVQPGGSQRDAESVAACDEHGLAMAFTGIRHFRH